MSPSPASVPCCHDDGHCLTCADEGTPMTVVKVDPCRGLALCADVDGARSAVETALVAPVAVGDRLLVHAGTAIASLLASDQGFRHEDPGLEGPGMRIRALRTPA